MIIEKNIIVSLDIPDPIAFSVDVENNLLSRLREVFEGKCYDECLILNVIGLVRFTEIVCGMPAAPAQGQINVEFRVKALVYMRDELLVAKITAVNKSGHLMASVERGNCMITAEKKFESLSQGQFVVVVVNYVLYGISTEVIAINASLFLPTRNISSVYKFDASLLDANSIEILRARMNEVDQGKYALNTKGWDTFRKLCYGFSEAKNPDMISLADLLDGKLPAGKSSTKKSSEGESSERRTLWLSRDIRMDRFEPACVITSPEEYADLYPGVPVIESMPPADVLAKLVNDWISYVNMLEELLKTYSDRDIIAKNRNVFAIYSMKLT